MVRARERHHSHYVHTHSKQCSCKQIQHEENPVFGDKNEFLLLISIEITLTCPCSSVVNAHQQPGSKIGPGTSAFHQLIITNNSYAHDEQGDNPKQEKEGSTVSSMICGR